MASNPITTGKPKRGEIAPEDPQRCCDWANARLNGYPEEREWIVTGNKDKPISLFRKTRPNWRP